MHKWLDLKGYEVAVSKPSPQPLDHSRPLQWLMRWLMI